jgi:ParB-like chromosome segregation protein Spo0J
VAVEAHPLDYFPDEETGDELMDSLALIDKAQAALARAQTLPEIGDVMAAADRAVRFIRRARLGHDAEIRAMRLRVDAERKAGGVLADMPRRGKGRPKNVV